MNLTQIARKFRVSENFLNSKEDGLLIETLTSTHTWFTSQNDDRFEVWEDCPPQDVDINELRKYCSLTCFMVEVSRNFPPANVGARDEAHLRLTGALARLNEKVYPTDLLNKFHERFCHVIKDTKEIKNRMKIDRQRAALANGKKVYGITDLREHLDSELEAYNLLFDTSDAEVPEQEQMHETDPKEYPLISGLEFDTIEYPKVDYILNPIFTTRSFNQIYGYYESGKTVFGLALSIAMASGQEFLGWSCDNSVPTLYVESELPAQLFKNVRSSILTQYYDVNNPENSTYRGDRHFTLTQDDLTNNGFKYGFNPIAVAKEHGKKAAEDYGRRGREFIEQMLYKIEERTGQKPFYFLDNMSRLATIDENKAPDWHPFINWGIDMKNKGYSGCFVHHANKGGNNKGSSGSSFIGRLLDTSIALRKLDNEYRFNMAGNKNLQSSIEFDKSRGFGGSHWTKKRIITMNEDGEWKHYPYLKQISFEILRLHEQGLTQSEIREMSKNKEIKDEQGIAVPTSTVDRLYRDLVQLQLIKKNRKTHCWDCKEKISTDADGSCSKCKTGIPCTNCGSCICEKPKKDKETLDEDDY